MSLKSGLDDIGVLSVTRQGVALSARLEAALPARLTVYVPEKYASGAPERYQRFPDKLQPVVDAAWARHEALIFIGAAGIAVRMIAPHVLDKRYDPGVVVMDIQGRYAIPLCSGHLGGANELARKIAQALGAVAAVTTGTDVLDTLAPDVLAKQIGADIENWELLKIVSGALVEGRRVGVLVQEGLEIPDLKPYADKNVVQVMDLSGCDAGVAILDTLFQPVTPTLLLRPPTLVLGVGCNSGTSEEELGREISAALLEAGLSERSVRAVATYTLKAEEPGLVALCRARGWPLQAYDAHALNTLAPPYERSETVFRHVGVWGVAEPAAMLAAGATRLVLPKQRRGNLTVAVARLGDRA